MRINTYVGALIITIVGSGAALLIIHVANTTDFYDSSLNASVW